jgi:hypothetical protein
LPEVIQATAAWSMRPAWAGETVAISGLWTGVGSLAGEQDAAVNPASTDRIVRRRKRQLMRQSKLGGV